MRYKLTMSYDGTNYHGFQKQKNSITVEEKLRDALFSIHKKPIETVASGRTDKGVHAFGQVVHFDSDVNMTEKQYLRALNSLLPNDIRVLSVEKEEMSFHARHHVKVKTYMYVIAKEYSVFTRNHELYFPHDLDLNLLKEALEKFVGVHDFFGFSGYVKGKPTIKEIYEASMKVENNKIYITFKGNGFLKYMVRRIVGTLLDVANKRKDISVIDEIFKTKDASLCGKTINPEGLYLVKVEY